MADVNERSLITGLKDMVRSEPKAYYLLWRYAPEYLPQKCKTFEELKKTYKCFSSTLTEDVCKKYITLEHCQTATKWLLKRLDTMRDIELYNTYYEKALSGDEKALRAYLELKKTFFEDAKDNELLSIINNMSIDDEDDDEGNFDFQR